MAGNVPNQELNDFTQKPSAVSIENLEDCATQDACDFQEHFLCDSSESLSDASPEKVNIRPVLAIDISNCLKDLQNNTTILSPISELAMNVANTKLCSVASDLGELVFNVS